VKYLMRQPYTPGGFYNGGWFYITVKLYEEWLYALKTTPELWEGFCIAAVDNSG